MMTNLARYIGMSLNGGGIVIGARDIGDAVEFRVRIDNQTEIHTIRKEA
jgi:hypothetical protein